MKISGTFVVGLVFAIVLFFVAWPRRDKPVANSPDAPAPAEVSAPTNPPPQVGYQLIVGANPRLNTNQVFSPPTNSVAITNNEQLRLLIQKSRSVKQQAQ